MFQVICTRGRTPAQVRPGPAAVPLRLRITLGTPRIVITPTPPILSVRIKEEKATKVGMPPAHLNPVSKALISKSGPPHDHFNWLMVEKCAEWLGLARGLFLTLYWGQLYLIVKSALWYETFLAALLVTYLYLPCALGLSLFIDKRSTLFKEFCAM